MGTITLRAPFAAPPVPEIAPAPSRVAAVLTAGCEGYAAGTHGEVRGVRQGCFMFAPDHPETVARWASPREIVLVPPGLLVTLR